MRTYFIDTETCGLHGVPVLLQYAIDDGPVQIIHLWKVPIWEVMNLIEDMVEHRVVAHNLRFDWFHISKLYNMCDWLLARPGIDPDSGLSDFSDEQLVEAEWQSQFGDCLKPHAAVDTLLLSSKGENQSYLMDAKAIYVRRIPLGVSAALCEELNKRTDLPWILFAGKKKNKDQRWTVEEHTDRKTGDPDPMWRDIKISFQPSKSLKDLAVFLCDHKPPTRFEEIACDAYPAEEGFAPFARLLCPEGAPWLYDEQPTWPAVIGQHIEHWASNEDALAYAEDDIQMLRKLYRYFGSPEDDRDGILACQVGSVRLRGFAFDVEGAHKLLKETDKILGTAQLNVNSPKQVLEFVAEALDEMEQFVLAEGCDQQVMDKLKKEFTLDEREDCYCDSGKLPGEEQRTCPRCKGVGSVGPGPMAVVERFEHIELIRKHTKRKELFLKLLLAKRAYPDFNVIGTKSGRMSGASGLNFQGIDHSDEVRSLFTLADPGLVLSAGDYSSQELAIAATTMNDDDLMRDMESGKSLHGLFTAEAFETTYEDIMANKDDGRYGKGKGGVFAILYGGTVETVAKNMGIEVAVAQAAYDRMITKYPQMGNTRKMVSERFSSMKQGPDRKIEYRDVPQKYIESVFGFRRYFNTEYALQKMILDVLKNPTAALKHAGAKSGICPDGTEYWSHVKVERTAGSMQTMWGACCSALYGAAFSIQNKIIRASNNHVIQSTGRELTIGMQAEVWSLQPCGIHPFHLTIMSIHDELAVVSEAELTDKIRDKIAAKVAEQCETVPLTSIEWYTGNKSWAEKGDGEDGVILGWNPGE